MALLEQISLMKQQGFSDTQIINNLQQEGVSYSQINEALSQSKIKSAIAGTNSGDESLQPSMMAEATNEQQTIGSSDSMNQQGYDAQAQQAYTQEQQYPAQAYAPQQYPQEQYAYPQQGYEQPQGAYYQQAIDLETVRDIAKQETDEALKKIREQINSFEKIKTEMKFEIQAMDNRLARIESVINELQSAILRKMGEYGSAISGISQEVRATQNSFAKIINPLLDKKRGMGPQESREDEENQQPIQNNPQSKPAQQKQSQNKPAPRANNSSASFEDYFR